MLSPLNRFTTIAALGLVSAMAHADWPAITANPFSNTNQVNAIKVDSQGNVYITGAAFGNGSYADLFLIKYDRYGNEAWSQRYGTTGVDEQGRDLAIDEQDNVFVLGEVQNPVQYDLATLKYSPSGVLKWTKFVGGAGGSRESAISIQPVPGGGVAIVGNADHTSYLKILVARYATSGAKVFSTEFGTGTLGTNQASENAVDSTGNIYVGGSSNTGSSYDFLTLKFSPLGQLLWKKKVDGSAHGSDSVYEIAVDSTDNVVVTGPSSNAQGYSSLLTQKYNPSGDIVWSTRTQAATTYLTPTELRLDQDDSIVISANALNGSSSGYVLKLSSAGVKQWSKPYSIADGDCTFVGLEIDNQGRIYVGGEYRVSGGDYYLMVRYSSNGDKNWDRVDSIDADGRCVPVATAINKDSGRAFLTGYAYNPASSNYDSYTVRY